MTTRCSRRSSAAPHWARCLWSTPRTAISSPALQQKFMSAGISGPEAHAYSRPPEVEGEATNRAITIADAAGVPVYIVHVSCEQAHEAIRRARQKGMRVYRRAAGPAPHAGRKRIFQPAMGSRRPTGDVAAVPPPVASGLAVGRAAIGIPAGGRDRSLRLHDRAEASWRRRLHQNSQWHRRPGRPPVGAVDARRRDRSVDAERVRRCHFDQHRPDPEYLSAQGRDPARLRRRHRRL